MAIDTTALTSRRALLAGVLGGTAAAVAASVAGAQRVLAAGDDGTPVLVGDAYDDVRSPTQFINNTDSHTAISGTNNLNGVGVQGNSSAGQGIFGYSTSGIGVQAWSPDGIGLKADAFGETSKAVHALAHAVAGVTYATLSEAWSPGGVAVLGNNYATTGHAQGVQGTSYSPAGYATLGWATKGGTAIIGASGPTFPSGSVPVKTGVYGYSQTGRGGVFQGKTAQVRLVPSTATTHPASGIAGDLFLDKSRRLWLCKGGSAWTRVA